MSRHTIRVVRKSRGADPAVQPDPSASLGRCVPPSSGCFLSLQPSTNLALVCRFLSSRDLLSAYKVSRALSAAAASPLTFQHEREWTIDHADKGIDTIGPAAVCTGERRLKAAMDSRLFRSFRILRIRAESTIELGSMLSLLQHPTAPILHILQIELVAGSSCSSSALLDFQPKSFAFVKVLSLLGNLPLDFSVAVLHFPFPQLQVFEVCHTSFPDQTLGSLLTVLPQLASTLRHIVIRSPSALQPSVIYGDLRLLMDIEAAVPDLTELHWLQQLDPRAFVDQIRQWRADHAGAFPQLHKIRFLQCFSLSVASEVHLLRAFSGLEDLVLSFRLYVPLDGTTVNDSAIHSPLSQTGLGQLRRLTLRQLEVDRPMMTPLTGFQRVFAAMPLLEEVDLGDLAVPLSAFARVPRLHTIRRMRFLAAVHDDSGLAMGQCFPSLTALSIPADPASRLFYSTLSLMPKLQTVQVRSLAPRPRDDFIREGLATYAALEAESAKLESQALKTTGWTQSLGSSETAAAAAAVVHASAHPFVEWHHAEPTLRPSNDLAKSNNNDVFYYLLANKPFSTGTAANAHKSTAKGDKHAATVAATSSTQAPPSSAPFSFGPPPSNGAPVASFPSFDFSSLSSTLPAPSAASFPPVGPEPFASASFATAEPGAAAAAAFASSAFVFAPPPSTAASFSQSPVAAAVGSSADSLQSASLSGPPGAGVRAQEQAN